jgi:hypothetical protein
MFPERARLEKAERLFDFKKLEAVLFDPSPDQ